MVRIACFDIGKKNFAFYTEECDDEVLKKLKTSYSKLPKMKQRKVKGAMTTEILNMQKELFLTSKRLKSDEGCPNTPGGCRVKNTFGSNTFGVFDLRDDKDSNDLDMQTRVNMQILLKSFSWLWEQCDVIVVEQQYFNITSRGNRGQGSGANVDAIKLAECCVCWFLDNYHPFKEICYFGSMYKTQTLGAPDKLTKPQRKKWSIEKGTEIFTNRGDLEILEIMSGFKNSKGKKQKLDDIFDCLIMCQAYVFRKFIADD